MSSSLVRASLPWCCGRTGAGAAAVGNSLGSRLRRPECYGQRVGLRCSSTPPPGFSMGPSPADMPELPSIDTPPGFEPPPGVDVPMPGTPPGPEQPGPSVPSPQTPEIPEVPPNPDIPPWSAPEVDPPGAPPEVVPPQPADVPPAFA